MFQKIAKTVISHTMQTLLQRNARDAYGGHDSFGISVFRTE